MGLCVRAKGLTDDDQNNVLPFPIKICRSRPEPNAYNRLPISWSDPNQGWGEDDKEEEA